MKHPTPSHGDQPRGAAPTGQQATRKRGRRGGRRRGKNATTLRRINATARERQTVWAQSGAPDRTEQLTEQLDDLYGELRDERKGEPGQPFRGRSASYVSPPTTAPKPWRGEKAR